MWFPSVTVYLLARSSWNCWWKNVCNSAWLYLLHHPIAVQNPPPHPHTMLFLGDRRPSETAGRGIRNLQQEKGIGESTLACNVKWDPTHCFQAPENSRKQKLYRKLKTPEGTKIHLLYLSTPELYTLRLFPVSFHIPFFLCCSFWHPVNIACRGWCICELLIHMKAG